MTLLLGNILVSKEGTGLSVYIYTNRSLLESDQVGVMHTGAAGLKHRKLAGKDGLFVDLIHLTALLGMCHKHLNLKCLATY